LLIITKKLRKRVTAGSFTEKQVGELGLSPKRPVKKIRSGCIVKLTEKVIGVK